MKNKIFSFIGGGTIARSLISSVIHQGLPGGKIIVSNRGQEKLQRLANDYGIQTASNNVEAVQNADVVVLAVKPPLIQQVSREIAKSIQVKKPLIISLAPGIRTCDIDRWLGGNHAVIRSMTNMSAMVGKATTALFANPWASLPQMKTAELFFNASGKVFWLDSETKLNKVTPLIGCGPAYSCLLIEAMRKSAEKSGVPTEIAKRIAFESVYGTVSLLQKTGMSAEDLRKNVTTPNGVTEHALKPLLEANYFGLFDTSFKSAEARCDEFADTLGKDNIPSVTNFFKPSELGNQGQEQESTKDKISTSVPTNKR